MKISIKTINIVEIVLNAIMLAILVGNIMTKQWASVVSTAIWLAASLLCWFNLIRTEKNLELIKHYYEEYEKRNNESEN